MRDDGGGVRRTVAVQFGPGTLGFRERETLRGIASHAEAMGWHVALDPYAAQGRQMGYDGVIATSRKGRGPRLSASPAPVVLVSWGHVHHPDLPRAVENRRAAGRLAAQHLVERGYETLAYVGFAKQDQSGTEREEFTRALRRLGRQAATARTFVTFASNVRWWSKVARSLGGWLERLGRPAGLFVATPRFARLLADLARSRGLRVPEDLGLIAGDDDPVLCALDPPLTSLAFDYAEVGRRGAELLGRLMAGGRRPRRRSILVAPRLVPRRSTDRAAARDPAVAEALAFIASHSTEPVRPADVAAGVGLSPRALGRRMRRARGRTVTEEIARARVAHAQDLLRHTPVPVAAVARQSGFGSYQAMLRAFRRHAGAPPTACRADGERDG